MVVSTLLLLAQLTPYRLEPLLSRPGNGDGGSATEAVLFQPSGLAEDAAGNVYISEERSNRIRRVTPAGVISTYVTVDAPTALLIAPDQSLLYFDNKICMIRKIATTGAITDLVGGGSCASAQGGFGIGASNNRDGKALETTIGNVGAMIYDSEGRLTFTETSLHIIRRLNSDGTIETIAGQRASGYAGDNLKAIDATLSYPVGLAMDADNNLYVADSGNCRVRRIDVTTYIETWIGGSSCATTSANYSGTRSTLIEQPGHLFYDRTSNALLIGLPRVYRVLRFNIGENRVLPYLGNGALGTTLTPAAPTASNINTPGALLITSRQQVLVASNDSYQVFSYASARLDRYAGKWPSDLNQLLDLRALLALEDGSILLLDSGTNRLIRRDRAGALTLVAGSTGPSGYVRGDGGPATDASMNTPIRMVRRWNGDIIIAESNRIRVIDTNGAIRTLRSDLTGVSGMAFDIYTRLLVSDPNTNRILRIDMDTGIATKIAGGNGTGFSGDGAAATSARINSPGDITVDSGGNIYFVDRGNRRIRRIAFSDGKISTVAGNGLPFSYADTTGETAKTTGFGTMTGLTGTANGDLYFSEQQRLTRISADGKVQIITGYTAQADDGTVTWRNEPLEDADSLLLFPDGSIIYSIRARGALMRAIPN